MIVQRGRGCLLHDLMGVKEFSEVVDVMNNAGKALCKFWRVHTGINDGHIPVWQRFDKAHMCALSSVCFLDAQGRPPCAKGKIKVEAPRRGRRKRPRTAPHRSRPYAAVTIDVNLRGRGR